MQVKLKNFGSAKRVVYDMKRVPQVIAPGQERLLNVAPFTVDRLEQAEQNGDTMGVIVIDAEGGHQEKQGAANKVTAARPVVKGGNNRTTRVRVRDVPPGAKGNEKPAPAKPPKAETKVSPGKPKDKRKVAAGEAPVITAQEALTKLDDYDYHTLLGVINTLAPKHALGPRPTLPVMVDLLKGLAKNEREAEKRANAAEE